MESRPTPCTPALKFRELPESELDRALDLAYLAFHEKPEAELRAHHKELLRGCTRVGAYDGDALVGTVSALPFTLSVPGGELPCPGVTFACVAPTHRRRGALSGMLAELFARCAAQDWPIAALWASEAVIYGRFGFGEGTRGVTVEIDSARPLALRIAPDDRPLRLLSPADAPAQLAAFYDRTRAGRPGRIARSRAWWAEEWMAEKDEEDASFSPPRVVALGGPGEPLAGYAIYRTKREDDAPGLVRLDDLEAETPAAAAALWQYAASVDLTAKVRAWGRPVDDPLLLFAADRDQVRVTAGFPALWLRLLDVRTALLRRSYAAPVDLVLDVHDAHLPVNSGPHRLSCSPRGVAYEPTHDPADLSLAVRDLAACYLGGTSPTALVRAGLATEHTPGAAETLTAALRTDHAPHTVDGF
ncbi:GNAT family N-acetyltransferase [Streptomyces cavernicola]|uniref:GNAT family N-acetyltransferase n=1 Tax=Streptomyces cavernicola TaxID=3043613 RepID=A0ABT6SGM5_9ACTN|nr:GNAT family N-acetyltransferase [Streptomyces sp. B-S-A6]MDI3407358.1 GNAT family N-acetyltransferase [Streptomyces sp. B-S-A6]